MRGGLALAGARFRRGMSQARVGRGGLLEGALAGRSPASCSCGGGATVNDQPLNTANGWSIQDAATMTEEYTVEDATEGSQGTPSSTTWAGPAPRPGARKRPPHRGRLVGASWRSPPGPSFSPPLPDK